MQTRYLMLAATAVALSACGGGSGGDTVAAPAAVVITSDNAVAVAGDVVGSVIETGRIGEFGQFLAAPAGSVVALATPEGMKSLRHDDLSAQATVTETIACAVSGTIRLTVTLASAETLSAGDRVSFEFNSCDDGNGQVSNGALLLTVDGFSGDLGGGFYELALSMDFDRLSIAEGNRTSRLDGALAMRLDATAYPMLEYEQSGARLSVTDGTHTVLLRNWNTALSSDQSSLPTAWTLAASGAVDVLEHGGSAVYQTLQPLTGFGEERPEAGVIRIVGGAGASIVVTALSSEQARLDMDYDGDGVIDEAVVVTWLELEG